MPMSKGLKIQMLKRGVTQLSIAKSLGVTREAVYQEFAGRRVSYKVRAAIVEAVGWPAKKIWPNETPRRPRGYNGRNGSPGSKPSQAPAEKEAVA